MRAARAEEETVAGAAAAECAWAFLEWAEVRGAADAGAEVAETKAIKIASKCRK
jgi:hypothetical protein